MNPSFQDTHDPPSKAGGGSSAPQPLGTGREGRPLQGTSPILAELEFELGEFSKVACSGVYLGFLEGQQALEAEAFDGETAHY